MSSPSSTQAMSSRDAHGLTVMSTAPAGRPRRQDLLRSTRLRPAAAGGRPADDERTVRPGGRPAGRRPHGGHLRPARTRPEHRGRSVAVDHSRGRGRRPGPHHRRRGGGPADVFGTSGGAVAGLALATHYPDKVGTLIAHEPPVTELVPDAPYIRTAVDDIEDAYREYGAGAAWGKFVSLVVLDGLVPDTGVPPAEWPPGGQDERIRVPIRLHRSRTPSSRPTTNSSSCGC